MNKIPPILQTIRKAQPHHLLIAAAALHLLVCTSVFMIGRFSLLPSQFDRDGVGQFAADGRMYLSDSVSLTQKLGSEGIRSWLNSMAPIHVRVYSISQILFGRLTGYNILSIEPINLLYYLATLAMVYQVGKIIFDRRSGLLAATIVALWPTLLIHTTQPLRDPLLVTLVTCFFLIAVRWLTPKFSWKQTIITSCAGVILLLGIWMVRLAMWDIVRAMLLMGLALFVARQLIERRFLPRNLVVGAILIAAMLLIPLANRVFVFSERNQEEGGRPLTAEQVVYLSLWERIVARRDLFIRKRSSATYRAGSDIDWDVRIHSARDFISYLPRAAEIGLFAPFPNMWLGQGLTVGRFGRWLSGAEMLLTYVIEALAVVSLWQHRRRWSVWLLAAGALLAMTALGLIVVNIGTIYRQRYPFWILLVILAAPTLVGWIKCESNADVPRVAA